MMQKSILKCIKADKVTPSVIKISQGENIGSHLYTLANDFNGSDEKQDYLLAPFDCIVRAYRSSDNGYLFENIEPVMTPSGIVEHICFSCLHMNDIDKTSIGIKVGSKFKQGDIIYREGVKGIGSGNHIHIGQAEGRPSGTLVSRKNGKSYVWDGVLRPQYQIDTTGKELHVYEAFFLGCKYVDGLSDVAKNYVWQKESEEVKSMEFVNGYQEYSWLNQKIHLYKQKADEDIGAISAKGSPDYMAVQALKDIDDDRTHMCKST